ncbi:MAG: acylphosphatase [Phycisphaerales bacterium]
MRQVVRYRGRVQGVGFRATVFSIARRHPVTGWVRNEPDGSVVLEVQGAEESVKAMLAEVHAAMERFITSEAPTQVAELETESQFVILR